MSKSLNCPNLKLDKNYLGENKKENTVYCLDNIENGLDMYGEYPNYSMSSEFRKENCQIQSDSSLTGHYLNDAKKKEYEINIIDGFYYNNEDKLIDWG